MRTLAAVALLLTAGCGPVAIALGLTAAFDDETVDQRELNIALMRDDPSAAFANAAEVAADAAATRRVEVETNKFALIDALLVGPGFLAAIGPLDATGCPLAFDDAAIAKVFSGQTAQAGPDRHFVTIDLPGPLADGEFELWVRARDVAGQRKCAMVAWTRDVVPPVFAPDLAVEANKPRALELSWQAAQDVGGSGVEDYRVYWDVGGLDVPDTDPRTAGVTYDFMTDGGADAGPRTSAGVEFSLTGLLAGRTHYLQVTAVDRAGNETPMTADDVAVASRSGGDGTFLPPAAADAWDMGPSASLVVVADFNGDDVPDIAAFEIVGETVSYRFGQGPPGRGDGTFGPRLTHRVDGFSIVSLAAADLDADGDDDLIVTDLARARALLSGGAADFFETGTTIDFGLFTGTLASQISLSDVDVDGLPDIVIGEESTFIAVVHAVFSRELGPLGYRAPDQALATLRHFSANAVGNPRVADFNSDNVLDVVFLDTASVRLLPHGDFASFLGSGPGFFQESVPYSSGAPAFTMELGDFNGDHIPDVVVGNNDNTIRVVAGTGAGGRGDGELALLPGSVTVPGTPSKMAVADFNDDGILDVAVSHFSPEGISILHGEGENGKPTGTLRLAQTVPIAEDPNALVARDVTGDGVIDLVMSMPQLGVVQVLRGRGATTVPTLDYTVVQTPIVDVGFDSTALSLVAADLNADGVDDIAFGVQTPGFGAVDVILTRSSNGKGLGTFSDRVRFNGGRALACADFNNDGAPDIAVQGMADVDVVPPLAPGDVVTINPEQQVLFGRGSDGRANGSFDSLTGVLFPSIGTVDVTLAPDCLDPEAAFRPIRPESIVAADFDGDGLTDFATLLEICRADVDNPGDPPFNRSAVCVFRGLGEPGKGDRNFSVDALYFPPCRAESLVAGDFNGDHVIDLAVSSVEDETVYFLPGGARPVGTDKGVIGDGTFPPLGPGDTLPVLPTLALPGLEIKKICAADFDRDGNLDLAVLHSTGVDLHLGDGALGFVAGGSIALASAPREFLCADLDNDDIPDVAVLMENGSVVIARGGRDGAGVPDGSLSFVRTIVLPDPARGIGVGEFNGDGIPDLVLGGVAPRVLFGHGTVSGQ